jgi:hypothetical protein
VSLLLELHVRFLWLFGNQALRSQKNEIEAFALSSVPLPSPSQS